MKTFMIALIALVACLVSVDAVRAQYVPGAIPAGRPRNELFPGTGPSRDKDKNKDKESDKKKERKKKADDDKKSHDAKKTKYDEYTKDQQDTQGPHYRPGQIYDPNRGDYIPDRYAQRLQDEMRRAERLANTSKKLYDDEK